MSKEINLKELLETKMEDIQPIEEVKATIEAVNKTVPKNLMFDAESTEFKPETVTTGIDMAVRPLSVEETQMFEAKINECIDKIFVEGIHYGSVPGVKKKFLFKAGAEVILSMMGLVARTEVIDKIEDYTNGVFSYTCKTWLIDNSGCVRAEGYGVCNSKENKYLKMNPYNIQNVLIKLARKRSLTDSTLSVASLSNKFSQDEDLVDMEQTPEANNKENNVSSSSGTNYSPNQKPVSERQLSFIEKLMDQHNTSVEALNRFIYQQYGVTDYRLVNSYQASKLIEKFKNLN